MHTKTTNHLHVRLDAGGAASVRPTPEGVRLIQVAPPADRPDLLWEDLVDLLLPDAEAVAATLNARIRAAAEGRPQRTLIDRILLSADVVDAWRRTVAEYVAAHPDADPADCGEETAVPLPDGRLLLCASVPEGDLSITIAARDWRWIEAS